MSVLIENCPCGTVHPMSDGAFMKLAAVTAGQPATIRVGAPGVGMWLVPRVYIVCHGLKADELPELAGRYGFERAVPERDDVRSLMQGFAAARRPGCPYGSPPGCRCANCYEPEAGE